MMNKTQSQTSSSPVQLDSYPNNWYVMGYVARALDNDHYLEWAEDKSVMDLQKSWPINWTKLGCQTFLSEQGKEIEENNRMGKTRDLFKKIRDTKGTFHAKMGSIKDRNCMDLTEAEDIKKRWQEYTEELYKTDLHDSDNHDGVITYLEPDILEC